MLKYYGLTICFFASLLVSAQSGWNWPEDPEMEKIAKEKQAFYRIQLQLEEYDVVFKSLYWLYNHVPDLNESIYIDGARVLDNLLQEPVSESRKQVLQDSLLWTYDARIEYFNNEASVMDRKAYTAFKMYYKQPKKYPLLLDLYEKLFSFPAESISDFNLTPYITLASYYYKSSPGEMPAEKVLDIHSTISNVIGKKISSDGNVEKLNKEQDKIDAFLTSIPDLLSCEFIEQQLVPKFRQDPDNLNMAKKIFSYSLKAKCTDKPYFVEAGETYYKANPSFALAEALADRFYNSNELDKALDYYTKARELAADDEQNFEALMGLATTLSKQENKNKARAMAYEALSVKPGSAEAFNLIGNLYYTSFEACKGGESKVKDRAVFIAAFKMYTKAGNTEQMAAAREQFPSIEEIFNEGLSEGDKITVDCWINESVVLQRRPQ